MFAELTGGSAVAVTIVVGFGLFLAGLGLGRWLKRRSGVRLGFLYLLFCASFVLWVSLEIEAGDFPHRLGVLRALRAANVFLGTFFLLALVRRYYWEIWFEKHRKVKAPKFLSQLLGLVAFIVAVFVVIGGIYGQSIEGAIFGSTVVVGIIGFAMQDLLGNIIAGLALELSKPFITGDWLTIDGQRAEVIEVNWRSTRLRTNDEVYLDIPNKAIVGGKIINLSYPTRQHAVRLTVGFDYQALPNFVKDVLIRATTEVPGVLAVPAPKAFLKEFGDSAINYEIKFWIDEETKFNDIMDGIRTNIWYAAKRHDIRIPYPTRTVQVERSSGKSADAGAIARAKVRQQPLLQLLDDAEADKLLASARLLRFGRGEKVLQEGDAGESMFILLSGEARVFVRAGDHETLVATLHAGDYCGEMSLLTGAPRNATVIARTDCEMWEIEKPVLAELLQKNETLVQKLGELLANRRLEREGVLTSEAEKAQLQAREKEYAAGFMKKLYSFFEL
jgi:small-conductance mechanosensitive channel/CRP-like cAMP-binding protein